MQPRFIIISIRFFQKILVGLFKARAKTGNYIVIICKLCLFVGRRVGWVMGGLINDYATFED